MNKMENMTKVMDEYDSERRAYISNVKGKYARLSSFISAKENNGYSSIVYGLRKMRARFMLHSWLRDSLNVSREQMQRDLSNACCANCDEHHLRAEIEEVLDPAKAFIEFHGKEAVNIPEFREIFRREFGKSLDDCLADMELNRRKVEWKQATRRGQIYFK